MKRLLIISVSVFFAAIVSAQQVDSVKLAGLGLRLDEYYDALKHESLDVQQSECDFLIETATDSLVRQYVAIDIFNHYLNSPIMGSENVAVYVFDKWFATGKVKMKGEAEYFTAKVYADFNRSSLIGKQAPELVMKTPNGETVQLFSKTEESKRFKVLFFYDSDCAKCKVETILLRNLMGVKDYPLDVYAIYVGDNKEKWDSYIRNELNLPGVEHLWDPELDSDFHRKYGVIQTPRIFLISPMNVILGRGLDVKSLEILIDGMMATDKLEYGGKDGEQLFDNIFSMSGGRPTQNEVKGIADYIFDKTLKKGDVTMFRQLSGDFLYYLMTHSGEGYKEGLKYHIDKNILVDNGAWTSSDDSLKVIGLAEMLNDLLSKSAVGTKVSSLKVPCEVVKSHKVKTKKMRLDKPRKDTNIIIFYTEDCQICAEEKNAAQKIIEKSSDVSVTMVNVDKVMQEYPDLAHRLMDTFDLSALPYILITDSDAVVRRRYVSLVEGLL